MLPPSHFVGRVARVIESESPLSNEYVTIEGCDENDASYTVRRVHPTANDNDDPTECVRADQLHLITGDEFTHRFPDACSVKGSTMTDEVLDGSIVDFSEVQPTSLDWGFSSIVIKGSCRLIGKPRDDGASEGTCTCIRKRIIIDTVNDSDIVEFEHLFFRHDDKTDINSYLITCKRGNIQFRNCNFINSLQAILVDGTVQVLMESCGMENMSSTAISIRTGEMLMINCVFSTLNMAILTFQRCTILFCSFLNCVGGIIAPSAAGVCITGCNFRNCSDFAVALRNGTTFSMTGCSVVGCNVSGIVMEGGHRTSAVVCRCNFSECAAAVRIGTGLVDAQLLAIVVEKCAIGVYTMIDTIGSVVIADYTVKDTTVDRSDASGSNCYTRIDGILLPHSVQRQRDDLLKVKDLGLTTNNPVLNVQWSISGKRQLKITGANAIACAKCGAKEPANTKFKLCGKCKYVFYCSKECQVEHWHASHRENCKNTVYRADCIQKRGYLGCTLCHKAELMHKPNLTLFSACSFCMQVVYCSEECQYRHWKVHKVSCKRHFSVKSK